jgi:cell division protein FtsQ
MKQGTKAMMKMFVWAVAGTGLCILCVSAVNYKKLSPLKGISVDISGEVEDGKYFMTSTDIEREITKVIGPLNKHRVGDVSCDVLEQELAQNPFIEEVNVYVSGNSKLTAQITQREPVMRVMSQGLDFYVDSKGNKLPVSRNHTARVHVITGTMAALQPQDMLELVEALRKDKFMNAFIDQVVYQGKNEIILIPKVGTMKILFGAADRITEKFENIEAFYTEVIATTGWDMYESIDVTYRNQIICKKNPTS